MRIFPPWQLGDWETVDDRVRGGKSHSEICQCGEDNGIVFRGTLDITVLGGAGFASQRYSFPNGPLHLPLTEYTGIRIRLDPLPASLESPNEFTFILNTSPITRRPDGRVESRVNWEATFTDTQAWLNLPFDVFQATYRGRPVEPPPVLDTTNILDISIMCRSSFGKQAGNFQVVILSVEAIVRST